MVVGGVIPQDYQYLFDAGAAVLGPEQKLVMLQ
jgi:hypothetical protein